MKSGKEIDNKTEDDVVETSDVKILIQHLDWKSPGGQGDCRIGFSSAGKWKTAGACFEFNSAIGLKGPRNLFLSLGSLLRL